MPDLIDLPNELLIHIFSHLHISDLGSCLLTCHRANDTIANSLLLQYLIRTALAGVCDPLLSFEPPLPHRLEALGRWSTAWHQPNDSLRSPSRIFTRRSEVNTESLVSDDYLVVMDFGGRLGYRHSASYEWLDLRQSGDKWTKVFFEDNLVPLSFTVDAARQNLLAVLFGRPESSTFQLRLLGFRDGTPHPLALRPSVDIELPTKETHYIGLKARISTIGSYIIIAVGLAPEVNGTDVILLLDWQKGNLATVRTTSTRTYLTDFVVVSDNVLALIRGPGNAVELCRLTSGPTPSLQTIRLLELPPLLPYVQLVAASSKTEHHTSVVDTHRQTRPPPRYPFSPSQDDTLVLLSLSARISGSAFVGMKTYTLATQASTLLSFANCRSQDSSCLVVPWDAWGPLSSRCFDGHSGKSAAVVAGQRWIAQGAIRDFCPRRVRASNGIIQRSKIPADRVFARNVETALPYHEVSLGGNEGAIMYDALVDSERIMLLVPEPGREAYTICVHTMG
ncbi:hypothetical protein H4582DRAFT_124341 [Lactarius indigo]|nr:hypothetical protein H4582DRAFT_124341 [Lactarius indigo]